MATKKKTTAKAADIKADANAEVTTSNEADANAEVYQGKLSYPARLRGKTFPQDHIFDDLTADEYNELKSLECLVDVNGEGDQ